jgi:hypothetical protein
MLEHRFLSHNRGASSVRTTRAHIVNGEGPDLPQCRGVIPASRAYSGLIEWPGQLAMTNGDQFDGNRHLEIRLVRPNPDAPAVRREAEEHWRG